MAVFDNLKGSGGKTAELSKFGSGSVGSSNGSTSSFTFTIPETCDLIVYHITNTNGQNGTNAASTGNISFSGLNSKSIGTYAKGTREYFVVIYNAVKGDKFTLSNIGQAYGAYGTYQYAYG